MKAEFFISGLDGTKMKTIGKLSTCEVEEQNFSHFIFTKVQRLSDYRFKIQSFVDLMMRLFPFHIFNALCFFTSARMYACCIGTRMSCDINNKGVDQCLFSIIT